MRCNTDAPSCAPVRSETTKRDRHARRAAATALADTSFSVTAARLELTMPTPMFLGSPTAMTAPPFSPAPLRCERRATNHQLDAPTTTATHDDHQCDRAPDARRSRGRDPASSIPTSNGSDVSVVAHRSPPDRPTNVLRPDVPRATPAGCVLEGRGGQTPARLAIRRAGGRLSAPSPEQVNTCLTLCGKGRSNHPGRWGTLFRETEQHRLRGVRDQARCRATVDVPELHVGRGVAVAGVAGPVDRQDPVASGLRPKRGR